MSPSEDIEKMEVFEYGEEGHRFISPLPLDTSVVKFIEEAIRDEWSKGYEAGKSAKSRDIAKRLGLSELL
jgi:hypothetical protein